MALYTVKRYSETATMTGDRQGRERTMRWARRLVVRELEAKG